MKLLTPGITGLLAACLTLPAHGRPGDVLPGGPVALRPGDVTAVALTPDGGAFLAGRFREVNGVVTGGLIRLKPDGSVDAGFRPGVGIGTGSCQSSARWGWISHDLPALVPLQNGGVAIGTHEVSYGGFRAPDFAILDVSGNPVAGAPGNLTESTGLVPQFESGGTLTVTRSGFDEAAWSSTRVLQRYLTPDWTEDPEFHPLASADMLPVQAIPAAGGGLWLLEGYSPYFTAPSRFRLKKLLSSGAADPAHTARPFESDTARLVPMEAGSFAVTSTYRPNIQPGPNFWQTVAFRGPGDEATSQLTQRGWPPLQPAPDGSLVMRDSRGLQYQSYRVLPSGDLDSSFAGQRAVNSIQRLPDGRMLLDGQTRILPDGSPDPTWTPPEILDSAGIFRLLPGPDGTVYGLGDFVQIDGEPRPGVARWLADGTLDPAFAPPPAAGSVVDGIVLTDSHLLILRRDDKEVAFQRISPAGVPDADFHPHGVNFSWDLNDVQRVAPLPGGEFLACATNPGSFDPGGFSLIRFAADGSGTVIRSGTPAWQDILTLPDGRFFHAGKRYFPDGQPDPGFVPAIESTGAPALALGSGWLVKKNSGNREWVLLRDDGSLDQSFSSASRRFPGSGIPLCTGPGLTTYWAGTSSYGSQGPERYLADGRREPAFRRSRVASLNEGVADGLPVLGVQTGADSPKAALLHPQTGELWVAGDFTRFDGQVRTGLVRLDASLPAGYSGWSAAIFGTAPEADAAADPDADGVENWREYAAGTDPQKPDAAGSSLTILTTVPFCVSAPRNPLAPEVVTVLEVSEDLLTWRTATGAEAIRKTSASQDAFTLTPTGPANRYCRVRYRAL